MVSQHDRTKALLLSVAVLATLLLLSACAMQTRPRLADVLEAKRGTGTQMEMLKLLGTPVRSLRVGADEVWVYLIPERNSNMEGQGMRTLACCFMLVALIAFAPPVVFAQGPAAAEFKELPDLLRLYFVAGYIGGFAIAAFLPENRAALMQRCFADWDNSQVLAIIDSWIIRNPREVSNPNVTARIAFFSALAEACGWKRK